MKNAIIPQKKWDNSEKIKKILEKTVKRFDKFQNLSYNRIVFERSNASM